MRSRSPETTLLSGIVMAMLVVLLMHSAKSSRPPAASASYTLGHGPTVVLVHGLGSRIEHWLPTARILAPDYRVVLAELPGHGETALNEPLTLERAASSLEAAIAREGAGPVTLVGHSLGGLVAAQVALDHPEQVRSLVLVETALMPAMNDLERRAMQVQLEGNYDGLVRSAYMAFGRDSAQGAALAAEAATVDPAVMKAWIHVALNTDLSQQVSALKVPTTAVFSDRTWPNDETWADNAKDLGLQRIPKLNPVRIAGCGHFVMLDRPDELARVIAHAAESASEPVAVAAASRSSR